MRRRLRRRHTQSRALHIIILAHTHTQSEPKAKDTMTQSVGLQEGIEGTLLHPVKPHDWGNNLWHISYVGKVTTLMTMTKEKLVLPFSQKKNRNSWQISREQLLSGRPKEMARWSSNFPYESRRKSINKVKYAKKRRRCPENAFKWPTTTWQHLAGKLQQN